MTINTRMRASLALIATMVLAACGSSAAITPAPTAAPPATTAPVATPAPVAGGAALSIANFAFDPATLKIKVGTKVTWTNNDGAPHTATSADGAFDSGRLSSGASFAFTFTTAGTFTYHCAIHSSMTGTITVSS